jgi:hypothetical protein
MMGDIPFYPPGYPCTGHADEGWFYDLVMIDEIVSVGFILRNIKPAAYFGKHTQPDIFIFEEQTGIGFICFFICEFIDVGVGVNPPLGSLVIGRSIKNGIDFRGFGEIGRDGNFSFLDFYFATSGWLIFMAGRKEMDY